MQVKKHQLELDMEQQTGSKSGKEYVKAIHCHLASFNLYAGYIMWNARLDEAQAGIKIAGRNISKLYMQMTPPMAESKEELKSLLMKEKEESEKADLKFNIQKTKIMASGLITPWQIDGETMETVRYFIVLYFKITADGDFRHEIKNACSLEEKLWPTFTAYSRADTLLCQQRSV